MNRALIRECTEEDLDAVCKMEEEWVKEDITWGQAVMDRKGFLKHLGPYFLVAEIETEVVGFALGSSHAGAGPSTREGPTVIPLGEQYLIVEEIYLAPGHRGRGVGSLLLDSLLQVARDNGVGRFLVGTDNRDLDRTLRFYRSHGFEPWSVQLAK